MIRNILNNKNTCEYIIIGDNVTRIFFFILGFLLMVIGFSLSILYLNISHMYNLYDYVNFIIRNKSFYIFLMGEFIINYIFIKGRYKNEKCL